MDRGINRGWFHWSVAVPLALITLSLSAQEASLPLQIELTLTNQQTKIELPLYPAVQEFKILSSTNLATGFAEDTSGQVSGYTWSESLTGPASFYRLQITPMSSNALLTATVLNRLAYGPTPDELERVLAMSPQAYIEEQLAPELIEEQLGIDAVTANAGWQYVSVTGTGSSSTLYVYLSAVGEGYVDDLMLIRGTAAGTGANLLRNGGFESPLVTNDWTISSNHLGSGLSTEIKHSGTGSLHLVATSGESTQGLAIWQTITPALSSSQQYTLSYWYLAKSNALSALTIRLSGSGITSSPDSLLTPATKLFNNLASIDDLRAWHVLHAVQSKRQLLEVLDQFLENHFVTQYSKSRDYFDTYYNDSALLGRLATQLEFKENGRWRQALFNPQCTFSNLLVISAESPAMIIYLDTVNSKGNGRNIANENYARELLELFTFGVDNGYDQADITNMAKCWTGWSVNIMDPTNEFNPLAKSLRDLYPGVAVSNLAGVWAFQYKQGNHNANSKTIFPGKTVPARFASPYAGRSYQLTLPARTGTNGIKDGYDVLAHLADQPFTQEFLSVKLCRLFVHDDFDVGYDFTDPNLSPEGQLVRECMMAWETNSPKGQIRKILAAIFNSELFRSHGASMHKVKTPLEFAVGTIRALRSQKPDGTFTAETDGYSLRTPMNRMGGMSLFDRGDPDGYPEAAPGWISAGTLAERLRFVQSVLIAVGQDDTAKSDSGRNNVTDPVALIKNKLPVLQWPDAGAVVDYFLSVIYPGEGKANLDLYRTTAINFLNTNESGLASPFSSLSMSGNPPPYDTRVRGMMAALLTFQRFQEQ